MVKLALNSLNEIVEDRFVPQNYSALCSFLRDLTRGKAHLQTTLLYNGEYFLLKKANSTTKERILSNRINTTGKAIGFFLAVLKNELNNKSRAGSLKEYRKLSFEQELIQDIDIEHIELDVLRSEQFASDPVDVAFKESGKTIAKMYEALKSGELDKGLIQAKYLQQIIKHQKDPAAQQILHGIVEGFKANLFFDKGKLAVSYKYTQTALSHLNAQKARINYALIAKMYNLQAMILLNQGDTEGGMKLFEFVLRELESRYRYDDSPALKEALKDSETCAFMFKSNTDYRELTYLIKKVFNDDEVSPQQFIYNLYAKAYLMIDHGFSDRAIPTLEPIEHRLTSLTYGDHDLNLIRYFTCFAEALCQDFSNRSPGDLDKAYDFVQRARYLNKVTGSNYFNGMFDLLEGYIISNKTLIQTGLKSLSYHNYHHYHDWYSKKINKKEKKR